MTYAQVQSAILAGLSSDGWRVQGNLKVPWALSPDGRHKLWFKAQSVYLGPGDGNFSTAHSMFVPDLRQAGYPPELRHLRSSAGGRDVRRDWALENGFSPADGSPALVYMEFMATLARWIGPQAMGRGLGATLTEEEAEQDPDYQRLLQRETKGPSRGHGPVTMDWREAHGLKRGVDERELREFERGIQSDGQKDGRVNSDNDYDLFVSGRSGPNETPQDVAAFVRELARDLMATDPMDVARNLTEDAIDAGLSPPQVRRVVNLWIGAYAGGLETRLNNWITREA